ncbi:MAG: DUF2111 domain-containing protein [Methanolobus sp.]|jgi:hypothetical protein|nr:DUF2111 domain-containing protein [Methanolobus sp.]
MMRDEENNDANCLTICPDSMADDLEPIAIAVHALLGIPVTIRSLNFKGIRMERGLIIDREYTGPVLEEVIQTNSMIRTVPKDGTYRGKSVVVAPLRNTQGEAIGAIGVVDLVAALDILSMFREYPGIVDEVEESRRKMK